MQKPPLGEQTLNQIQTLKANNIQMQSQIIDKKSQIAKLKEYLETYKEQSKLRADEIKDLEKEKSVFKEKIMVLEIKFNDSTKKLDEGEQSIKKYINEI